MTRASAISVMTFADNVNMNICLNSFYRRSKDLQLKTAITPINLVITCFATDSQATPLPEVSVVTDLFPHDDHRFQTFERVN